MKLSAANLRYAAGVAILIAALAVQYFQGDTQSTNAALADDAGLILSSFENQRSDVWVESGGIVERELKDDREGSAHQRFIVRLSNDHTILIAHNIDLAPRVPLAVGDRVSFRGEFEWNSKGGVVHWTHHDPKGNREGGFVRFGDKDYR